MDFHKNIKNAEEELSRLAAQREQETAMLAVLPVRHQTNMAAFEKYMPGIHAFFKEYQPTRPFRFFCNENGIPNILWLDEQVSLYGHDPFLEAQAQIDDVIKNSNLQCADFEPQWYIDGQIHIKYNNEIASLKNRKALQGLFLKDVLSMEIPLSMMYGIGLGYQLGYFYERCKVRNLFAFEPDLDMFYASLFCFDWCSLLEYMDEESLSLHLFIGVDEALLAADMMEALHRKGAFWSAAYFSFSHYHSAKLQKLINLVEKDFYLLRTGWGFFDDNIYALAHSHCNIKESTLFLKKQRDLCSSGKTPVFVVGNGPSLDQDIDFIRSHQHQAVVIACGTAISALYKAEIKPDIYVAVERTKSSADFLHILDANEFIQDTVFLSVDVIHPDCKQFFRKTGLAFKPNEPMFKLLSSYLGSSFSFDTIDFSNPFVGNTGVNYAVLLGFKNIYLFGIDNGFKSADKHHSSLSLYYNNQKEAKYNQDLRDTFPARGNFGREILINNLFGLSIHNMERVLYENPSVNCFNCSDGAYIEGAISSYSESLNFDWPVIDKVNIVDEILGSNFEPIPFGQIDFQGLLNVAVFDEIIDMFRDDWKSVVHESTAIQGMMQQHHDHLLYFLMGKNSHIYRVLIGSINYFYANIITLLFALKDADEETFEQKVENAISILDKFFCESKMFYLDAFNKKDSTYFSGLDIFK
ncbi:TPA: 6-hydroxymethylpterin diphosphokinase MptE-like protein [Aeromonas hydrophila]|uniref:motility associated factor glycosyltransferase family protein n=1 Tax=Aeromonas hydrophila TaxID=644 RepID=UPI00107E9819|nr:6-hydroxymethylpterin diphosphokinase MptE-like protein [Aeromonas hydrophila]MCV3292190.1 DUF115 domain-containing protein [Aeromonas hydrophila]QBX72008.1 DUF115 domain-containing protein [Aeromonas hydrophila]QBX76707.1 DUF115 domain-containing protein [Aeromonas hydrophila]